MRITGLTALSLIAFATPSLAWAQTPAQSRPPAANAPARRAAPQGLQVPQAAGLVILIRGTISALNQANLTGNYTVLHALGSDTMRANTNPQSLAQAFAAFRQRGVDLSPMLVLNPQLSQQAAISGNRLHLVGRFPSQPYSLTFDLWFEISQNRWKPVQINAGLAATQAQQGQAQPPRAGQPPAQQQPRQAQPQQATPRKP